MKFIDTTMEKKKLIPKPQNEEPKIENEFLKRSYRFSVAVIKFTAGLPEKRIYGAISGELERAVNNIGVSIIDGQAESSKKEVARYYKIALKSANETKYWLALMRDALDGDKVVISRLMKETSELAKLLASNLRSMSASKQV
jgi:four helix bundle protein